MNCWRVQNLVAPFLDGLLPGAEAASVEEHLERCPECQDLVGGVASLPPLTSPSVGGADEAALMAALQRQIDQSIEESRVDDFLALSDGGSELHAPSVDGASPRAVAANRPLQISAGLAAAYLAVAMLLAGGVVANHLRVRSLEDSLASRDALIDALQDRLVTAEQPAFADYGLVPGDSPVFLPAAAPAALPPRCGAGGGNRQPREGGWVGWGL